MPAGPINPAPRDGFCRRSESVEANGAGPTPHPRLPQRRAYARSSARFRAMPRARRTAGRRTPAHSPPPMTPRRASLPAGRPSNTPDSQKASPARAVSPTTHGVSGSGRFAADRSRPRLLPSRCWFVMTSPRASAAQDSVRHSVFLALTGNSARMPCFRRTRRHRTTGCPGSPAWPRACAARARRRPLRRDGGAGPRHRAGPGVCGNRTPARTRSAAP